MTRNKIIDIAIVTLLYIGICTFPTNLITDNEIFYYLIEVGLMTLMILFIILYVHAHGYLKPEKQPTDFKTLLLFIPVVVVAISNFLYAWILKEPLEPVFSWASPLQILFILLLVTVEEVIFRYLMLGNITKGKPIVRIIIAAGIFALCHLTHFFSTFNPVDLVVVAYSFGLGIVFGLIYYYSHNLVACIGLHFLFNFCNDFLFVRLYSVSNMLWYFLINGIVALVVGLYLLGLYLLKLRKNPAELG